jgi:O-antigen ligase
MEAGSALLFLCWMALQATNGELRIQGSPLFAPMVSFAALVFLQLVTGSSAYRYATFSAALLYCAYGVICFLVVQCLRRTRQIRVLATLASAYGLAMAAFALLQSLASNGKIYWIRTVPLGSGIYGPYVNHNHYAGLMEVLYPIPLVACFSRRLRTNRKVAAGMIAAFMASTIFLSGSRGGMVAFAVQMVVLAVILLRQKQRGKAALALGIFIISLAGLLAWLGASQVTDRLATIHSAARQDLSVSTRLAIDRDGLKMFARKPALGWGLGVFPEVYPQFRSFYTSQLINQAHNDYLQLLVETGALGFAFMLWFLIPVYRNAMRKLRQWPPDTSTATGLAAMLGVSGIVVHSFVDFNLQIPANAALFFVLCTIAAMEPQSLRRSAKIERGGVSPGRDS